MATEEQQKRGRRIKRLTAMGIAALPKGKHCDGENLWLYVKPTGTRNWVFRYAAGGKSDREYGLGPFPRVSLKDARAKAKQARDQLDRGIDPIEAKRKDKAARIIAQAKAMTFAEAAKRWWQENAVNWTVPKVRAQVLKKLEDYAFPHLGHMPVGDVDTPAVLRVLKPIWHSKNATASAVRSYIEAVLAWATVHGFRSGDNPARWTGHLKEALPSPSAVAPTRNQPALPYEDIAAFMSALRNTEGVVARALEFAVLTAGRSKEVYAARWAEIDLEAGVWTVPAGRMKGGREHRVALCDDAIALLKALREETNNPFVFPGTRARQSIGPEEMSKLMRRMKKPDGTPLLERERDAPPGGKPRQAVPHGLRSAFRDWAGDVSHQPHAREVAEAALAHAMGDATERAYRRGDALEKRRALMNEWADYCAGITREGVVVPFGRAK